MSRAFRVALCTALAAVVMTTGVNGNTDRGASPDAVAMAGAYGLSVADAEHRLVREGQAGGLEVALAKALPDRFAGLWIDPGAEFDVTVAVVRGAEASAAPIVNRSAVQDAVRVVGVEHSLAALIDGATKLRSRTDRVPFDVDVDVVGNRVVVYTTSKPELTDYLALHGLELPSFADVEVVDELAQPAADIYGGLPLSCGTSGFSVRSTVSGERGITAAGHCGNQQSYQGAPLAWRTTRFFGNHDEAWFSAPGLFNVRSGWINDGLGGRNIIAVRHRDNQAVGAFVCKYGRTTLFDCGNVTSRTFAPSYVPQAAQTFMLAKKTGVDMASAGDSGGPVFSSNGAWGIVSGSVGSNNIDQVIYVAINYVEAGMSVRVTFPGQ